MSQKVSILKELGIKVDSDQVDLAYQILQTSSQYQDFFKARNTIPPTKVDEDLFIQTIRSAHAKIAQIPENFEVIQSRQNTFTIRAIDPDQINSLTDRAFFNSFNLQRNALNDINSKHEEQYDANKEDRKRAWMEEPNRGRNDGEQDQKCICERIIPNSQWVQCINEEKCRGSNWYHLQCAGFQTKDIEKLKEKQFICQSCKRQNKDDESDGSSRKRKKEEKDLD